MAINVTARDVVNFPGGTPKTITLDIAQIVPVQGHPLEGDEIWVSTAASTATASGGGSIQTMFKSILKRGWLKAAPLQTGGTIDIPASYGMKVAIDQAIGSGVDIELEAGDGLLPEDVAIDIETKIRNQARFGLGGAKIGNLSYLNCQVRYQNGRFVIESGTVTDTYTGTGRSSVKVDAPSVLSDVRPLLGFDIPIDSETLASRQIVDTDLTSAYTTGNTLSVRSTAGLATGDAFVVTDGTNTSTGLVSVVNSAASLDFITVGGGDLSATYSGGAFLRKLQVVDIADPVSAVTSIDQMYRFCIDSIVNQINFAV